MPLIILFPRKCVGRLELLKCSRNKLLDIDATGTFKIVVSLEQAFSGCEHRFCFAIDCLTFAGTFGIKVSPEHNEHRLDSSLYCFTPAETFRFLEQAL